VIHCYTFCQVTKRISAQCSPGPYSSPFWSEKMTMTSLSIFTVERL